MGFVNETYPVQWTPFLRLACGGIVSGKEVFIEEKP
jgi:hypothetical protein